MGGAARHAGRGRGAVPDAVGAGADLTRPLPGSVPSPNIWHHREVYETENRATDQEQRIEAALRDIHDWSRQDVLDVGCGTGFHLPRWAVGASSVVGVEPHPDLAAVATRRTARLPNVTVLVGAAQRLPLPDRSVDVAQARWAYFFGPGCEPGLRELDRVVRRGGTAFVVDIDGSRSTFGSWFRRAHPTVDPETVQRFWSTHGWQRRQLDVVWRFGSRADLEAVVRIELDEGTSDLVLARHEGLEVDQAVNVFWRGY
jgi:ubiquinone/menaquinone biosynthesis C-methylase UbiE